MMDVFVYGTLQSAMPYHHLCGRINQVKKAQTWGRLYALSEGYPALELPSQMIVGLGTCDYQNDANLCQVLLDSVVKPSGDWDCIHGELLNLNDPNQIERMDEFEDFSPNYENSLYLRQLVPVLVGDEWAYVWAYHYNQVHDGRRIKSGCWKS